MRVGVFCRYVDQMLYDITYKNHKLYCYKHNMSYEASKDNIQPTPSLMNKYDYILYIDENHRFMRYDSGINEILDIRENILYSKIDSTIDNKLIMISTNNIGRRIMNYLTDSSLQELVTNYSIDIENTKGCKPLPPLFKVPIDKYAQYIGIRNKIFLLDTQNINSKTASILHQKLNRELGIK